jgi:hypothetical protein
MAELWPFAVRVHQIRLCARNAAWSGGGPSAAWSGGGPTAA